MRTKIAVCALIFVSLSINANSQQSKEIAADHNPIKPGETVTLHWNFTGTKVTLSGGRFGTGAVVTGKTSITDKPAKTTTYVYNVDYLGAPAGAKDLSTKVPLHVKYSITVQVVNGAADPTAIYVNPYGWQVSYLKGWKRDNVAMGDPANNALMYFQPEEDSVDRLAVSVLPVKEPSPATLMSSIQADIYSHYDSAELISKTEMTHHDAPAVLACFAGIDNSHPGVKTQSLVLVVVRNGRGYVVSARTRASQFAVRQAFLEKLVKSFAFTQTSASSNQRSGVHGASLN